MSKTIPVRVLVTGATGFLGRNLLVALTRNRSVVPVAACRDRRRLPADFHGEIREGNLLDSAYRRDVVRDVNVVCHAGTWASLWNHRDLERRRFYEPARDLIEQSISSGVGRFVMAGSVAMGSPTPRRRALGDFSATCPTGFWPHLDRLIDLDGFMRANSRRGTQMVMLRLGHFVGEGNRIGLVPALIPRLKTRLVPWLGDGTRRLPLVADSDLGEAFALAAAADGLADYESFNICGPEFPTLREVVEFVATEADCPRPRYRVPYSAGYFFGWLMEKTKPFTPGASPFLTRSIVHLCEDWPCSTDYAARKLGYRPHKDWRVAIREQLAGLRAEGDPWPALVSP